eukprot:g1097.t1
MEGRATGRKKFRRGLPSKIRRFSRMIKFNDGVEDESRAAAGSGDGDSSVVVDESKPYDSSAITTYIRDNWIRQKLCSEEVRFSTFKPTNLFVSTFNVNGKKPGDGSLRAWLSHNGTFPGKGNMPSLYVVGFQEIVDLSAANVIATDSESHTRTLMWQDLLQNEINAIAKPRGIVYEPVAYKYLVGVALCIFVSSEHREHVGGVQSANAASGIMGVLGNKGGSSIRFQFYDTTVCFVCSHLAAHRGNVGGRNSDFASILEKTEFKHQSGDDQAAKAPAHLSTVSSESHADGTFGILDHDVVVWLGDLNYRIMEGVTIDVAYEMIEEGNRGIDYLLKWDQLNRERDAGRAFQSFEEGDIRFLPSYKFIPGTDQFDNRKEKKMRVPAWCDRVLWRVRSGNQSTTPDTGDGGRPFVELVDYARVDSIDVSDHKPVAAIFSLQVKEIDREKQKQAYSDIIRRLDKWENDSMPKVELQERDLRFDNLNFDSPRTVSVSVKNTGLAQATFRFVPKLEEKEFCKPWLSLHPSFGMIPPGESLEVEVTACLDRTAIHTLNCGRDTLDDILILRFENGPHFFLSVSGSVLPTCFGMPLGKLVEAPGPVRGAAPGSGVETSTPVSIPSELWRLVDALYKNGAMQMQNLFIEKAQVSELHELREALDTGSPFRSEISPYAFAITLIDFLENLATPVLPFNGSLVKASGEDISVGWCTEYMATLPPVNHNVFVYVVVFLKELLTHTDKNRLTATALADIFATVFTFPSTWAPVEDENFLSAGDMTHLLQGKNRIAKATRNARCMILIYLSA